MYLPGAEKFFDRHPFAAFLLFSACAALIGWLFCVKLRELRAFPSSPEPVAIQTLVSPPADTVRPGRWVSLQGPLQFLCEHRVAVHFSDAGGALFGESVRAYIPATDPAGTRLIIFVYNRDLGCVEAIRHPRTGVLRGAQRDDIARMQRVGMQVPPTLATPVMELETFAGPRDTWKWLILSFLVEIVMVMGVVMYGRKWKRKQYAEETGWAQPRRF